MKYTIEGFNQEKLVDDKLDCVDAIILRWYADFQLSGKMKEIKKNNKTYYWLKYDYALKEIPIINIKNKKSFFRRMNKIKKAGYIEHYTLKSGGTFSCYKLSEKYYELISKISKDTQKSHPCDSKVTPPCDSKVTTNNSSIKGIYKSIRDIVFPDKLNNELFINKYNEWLEYRKEIEKKLTISTINKQLQMLEKYDIEIAIQAIEKSIGAGWTGLFPEGIKKNTAKGGLSDKDREDIIKEF